LMSDPVPLARNRHAKVTPSPKISVLTVTKPCSSCAGAINRRCQSDQSPSAAYGDARAELREFAGPKNRCANRRRGRTAEGPSTGNPFCRSWELNVEGVDFLAADVAHYQRRTVDVDTAPYLRVAGCSPDVFEAQHLLHLAVAETKSQYR